MTKRPYAIMNMPVPIKDRPVIPPSPKKEVPPEKSEESLPKKK
jgi:hypothetical protein